MCTRVCNRDKQKIVGSCPNLRQPSAMAATTTATAERASAFAASERHHLAVIVVMLATHANTLHATDGKSVGSTAAAVAAFVLLVGRRRLAGWSDQRAALRVAGSAWCAVLSLTFLLSLGEVIVGARELTTALVENAWVVWAITAACAASGCLHAALSPSEDATVLVQAVVVGVTVVKVLLVGDAQYTAINAVILFSLEASRQLATQWFALQDARVTIRSALAAAKVTEAEQSERGDSQDARGLAQDARQFCIDKRVAELDAGQEQRSITKARMGYDLSIAEAHNRRLRRSLRAVALGVKAWSDDVEVAQQASATGDGVDAAARRVLAQRTMTVLSSLMSTIDASGEPPRGYGERSTSSGGSGGRGGDRRDSPVQVRLERLGALDERVPLSPPGPIAPRSLVVSDYPPVPLFRRRNHASGGGRREGDARSV